jgi:pyruvate carboxylase subunit B
MRYFVGIGEQTVQVDVEPDGLYVDGERVEADLDAIRGTDIKTLLLDGASYRIAAQRRSSGWWGLHLRGRSLEAEVIDERTRAIREMSGAAAGPAGPRPVRAPMPGLVVRVEVAEGEEVEAGQGLVIVEAMKMENELTAEAGGRVGTVHVTPGQAVEKDQILLDFLPPERG